MNTTFATEDQRKNKLFAAWIEHLNIQDGEQTYGDPDEVYEGLATFASLATSHAALILEDDRKVHIRISPEVSEHSYISDSLYIILAHKKGRWYAIDVISISSLFGKEKDHAHLTINPSHMPKNQEIEEEDDDDETYGIPASFYEEDYEDETEEEEEAARKIDARLAAKLRTLN